MDTNALLASLRRENPASDDALKIVCAGADRAAANQILMLMLTLQHRLESKRATARTMLRIQPGVEPHHALCHIPDVMIRKLCDIADVQRMGNASDEWLDKMEAKHVNDQI